MPETSSQNNQDPPVLEDKKASRRKKQPGSKLLFLIMQYKESKFYQLVNRHPEIAIAIVALWGMLIIVTFLWFVFNRMVPG